LRITSAYGCGWGKKPVWTRSRGEVYTQARKKKTNLEVKRVESKADEKEQ